MMILRSCSGWPAHRWADTNRAEYACTKHSAVAAKGLSWCSMLQHGTRVFQAAVVRPCFALAHICIVLYLGAEPCWLSTSKEAHGRTWHSSP